MEVQTQLYLTSLATLNEEVKPLENYDEVPMIRKPKPGTGMWTSTWKEETHASDWVEWCRSAEFGSPDTAYWWLLTPKQDVKLYVIDSLKDLHVLARDYGYTPSRYKDMGLNTIGRGIDFVQMAKTYDGVWLTEHGNSETHLSYPIDLNAWDCESIVWFRWCFVKIERTIVGQLQDNRRTLCQQKQYGTVSKQIRKQG